jgi:hypothetical protein
MLYLCRQSFIRGCQDLKARPVPRGALDVDHLERKSSLNNYQYHQGASNQSYKPITELFLSSNIQKEIQLSTISST